MKICVSDKCREIVQDEIAPAKLKETFFWPWWIYNFCEESPHMVGQDFIKAIPFFFLVMNVLARLSTVVIRALNHVYSK